jgi:hypothetical protein
MIVNWSEVGWSLNERKWSVDKCSEVKCSWVKCGEGPLRFNGCLLTTFSMNVESRQPLYRTHFKDTLLDTPF